MFLPVCNVQRLDKTVGQTEFQLDRGFIEQ